MPRKSFQTVITDDENSIKKYYFLRPRNVINYSLRKCSKLNPFACKIKVEQNKNDSFYQNFAVVKNSTIIKQELSEVPNHDAFDKEICYNTNEEVIGVAKSNNENNSKEHNQITDNDFGNFAFSSSRLMSEYEIKKETIEDQMINSNSQLKSDYEIIKIKDEPLTPPSVQHDDESDDDRILTNHFTDSLTIKKELHLGDQTDTVVCAKTIDVCVSTSSNRVVENIINEKIKRNLTSLHHSAMQTPVSQDVSNAENSDELQYFTRISPFHPVKLEVIKSFNSNKKKVILIKEELSESEKERIELERDNDCRAAATKTGGVWRRLPEEGQKEQTPTPKVPDKVIAYTPAGQRLIINTNVDRPDEFPTEKDREQWDYATTVNISNAIHDIEHGYYIPPEIDDKKEEEFINMRKIVEHECEELLSDQFKDISEQEMKFYDAEEKILRWDYWVKTRLFDKEEEINLLLNDIIGSQLPEFLFVKHDHILATIKKVMKQKKYTTLHHNTSVLYTKIKNIFNKTDEELENYIAEKAKQLKNAFKDFPISSYMLLTPFHKVPDNKETGAEVIANSIQENFNENNSNCINNNTNNDHNGTNNNDDSNQMDTSPCFTVNNTLPVEE
ncbi:uncharacterized protein LOC142324406 [Lycorma delicatula]|uniref:uncharacterized protein LOC142324406 n=1 Tax=Lycorma delicatula TaxID=130591 RepID=UPI003F5169BF